MQVKTFNGLNNVSDPLGLGLSWLSKADNINITAAGKIERRDGYALATPAIIPLGGAYSTIDYQHGYLVDAGSLKSFDGAVLRTGLSARPMYWTEINDQVFYSNGQDSGIIQPGGEVLDWAWNAPAAPALAAVTGSLAAGLYQVRCTYVLADGRETGSGDSAEITLTDGQAVQISGIPKMAGASTHVYIAPANSTVYQFAGMPSGTAMVWNFSPDALGTDLQNLLLDSLPIGTEVLQAWRGRIYASQYLPEADQSVIWFSQPLGFHLFNISSDFLLVPGHVVMLAPQPTGLLIGALQAVYAYDGTSLAKLASYGVVPGQHWSLEDDKPTARAIFWTERGACAALPFENLTEGAVSVAPGLSAGGTVVHSGGNTRYIVSIKQGGTAFNLHS